MCRATDGVKLMKHVDLNPDRAGDNDLVLHSEDPVLMAEIAPQRIGEKYAGGAD